MGKSLRLDVENPAEAIRALIVRHPEADKLLQEGRFVIIRRRLDETTGTKTGRFYAKDLAAAINDPLYQLEADMLTLGLGKADMHLIPVVGGAGGRGMGKVVLGLAMVAGAFVFAPMTFGGAMAGAVGQSTMSATAVSLMGMNVSFGTLATMGAMVALGGVSMMLAKAPAAQEAKDKNESYIFSGPANVASQSNPVPLVYGGPIRTGSVTVSSEITTIKGGTRFGANFDGIKGSILA